MGVGWNTARIQLSSIVLLVVFLELPVCFALNFEGHVLLKFCSRVDSDLYEAFANWNPYDHQPCLWTGVHCQDGKVNKLDLSALSLRGTLAPELGKLTNLRYLILPKNQFFGAFPKQLGLLTKLEVLDLRENSLSGAIPEEIGKLHLLKHLLLSDNNFEGRIPSAIWKLGLLVELQIDENPSAGAASIGCINRKFGHCIWKTSSKPVKREESFPSPLKLTLARCLNVLPLVKFRKGFFRNDADGNCNDPSRLNEEHPVLPVRNVVHSARRRLAEQSSNLAALVYNGPIVLALPSSISSGTFPAIARDKKQQSPPPSPSPQQNPGGGELPKDTKDSSDVNPENKLKYIVGISTGVFLLVSAAMLIIFRSRAANTIGPWKTGLSGQLQKAFVTGVPKLNRGELETACEDFSNIISSTDTYVIYKGTLSSGVEIAVASTTIASVKDWTTGAEVTYRKKIDSLSCVNHKNFSNLIGYCEEGEPFGRMLVFEYAPNGTLAEHLHVKELEHLDWSARMRIIMGTAYCLQCMHDLNPPVAHSNLVSSSIFLTDDYAAKVTEIGFWSEIMRGSKNVAEQNSSEYSELPQLADPETNVYSFGVLLLEIISGKPPHSEEHGPILQWAAQYLDDEESTGFLLDPTLVSYKEGDLEIICEVIQECVQPDPSSRPTMSDLVSKLRRVLDISPEAAMPRLSPLWWAELEILSAEAP